MNYARLYVLPPKGRTLRRLSIEAHVDRLKADALAHVEQYERDNGHPNGSVAGVIVHEGRKVGGIGPYPHALDAAQEREGILPMLPQPITPKQAEIMHRAWNKVE